MDNLSYYHNIVIDNNDKKTSKPAGCEAVYRHEARRPKWDEAVNGRIIVSIFSLVIVEWSETVCVAVFINFANYTIVIPLSWRFGSTIVFSTSRWNVVLTLKLFILSINIVR